MKKQGLIIDTNLLLLLVIGALESGRYISLSKRLNGYTVDDYDVVVKLIGDYDQVYITPYIAAEVSNLIDLHEPAKTQVFEIAQELFCLFEEIPTKISENVIGEAFLEYGLADASLIKLVTDYCVLTADEKLSMYLYKINSNNTLPYYLAKQLWV